MKWIRLDVSTPDHPLIHDLAKSLEVGVAQAFGHYAAVVCRMGEHREDGRLADVPDGALESWACWQGKKGRFALALRRLCQTEDGQIKGWWRQEQLRLRAENHRERMRNVRAQATHSPRTESARAAANDTRRNGTVQEEEKSSTARAKDADTLLLELPVTSHAAFEGHLRASRKPEALIGELRAMAQGLRGTAYSWAVIGQALEELAVDGGPCTAIRLRAFAKRIMQPDAPLPGKAEDPYEKAARELEAESAA